MCRPVALFESVWVLRISYYLFDQKKGSIYIKISKVTNIIIVLQVDIKWHIGGPREGAPEEVTVNQYKGRLNWLVCLQTDCWFVIHRPSEGSGFLNESMQTKQTHTLSMHASQCNVPWRVAGHTNRCMSRHRSAPHQGGSRKSVVRCWSLVPAARLNCLVLQTNWLLELSHS